MLLHGDSLQILKDINNESIDLIVTDPPYGIEFMGKDWDKALPSIDIWKECFRVLKTGKLAFVMCSPRQDVLSRMIISLEDSGFRTNYTSIYWTYASGFPKAANVSKLIDKRNGRYFDTSVKDYLNSKRKEKGLSFIDINNALGASTTGGGLSSHLMGDKIPSEGNQLPTMEVYIKLKHILELDSRFDELIERTEAEREIIGKSETGYSEIMGSKVKGKGNGLGNEVLKYDITKPATEEAKKMEGAYVGFQPKPAVEVILVVSKGKTLTWLDSVRIPYDGNNGEGDKGRFPANLLVSDDVLNDGHNYKVGRLEPYHKNTKIGNVYGKYTDYTNKMAYTMGGDSGSYSRYFDLDKWFSKTFPFLIVPKASKSEKNQGVSNDVKVNHPTIKPLKLFSYLITMGSRENDLILDPFCGSGTTLIAADNLARKYIGIEINKDYLEIAKHRLLPHIQQTKLDLNQYITPAIEE